FTYWGRGEPDLALTAYALRFLSEARNVVSVDEDVMNEARDWLVKQQRAYGSWPAHEYWSNSEDKQRSAMLKTECENGTVAYLRLLQPRSPSDCRTEDIQNQVSLAVGAFIDSTFA